MGNIKSTRCSSHRVFCQRVMPAFLASYNHMNISNVRKKTGLAYTHFALNYNVQTDGGWKRTTGCSLLSPVIKFHGIQNFSAVNLHTGTQSCNFFYAHSIYQAYKDLKMAMKVCFLPSYVHIQANGGNIELDEQELSGHKWNKCTVASGTNPSLIAIQSHEYTVYISGDANYRKESF